MPYLKQQIELVVNELRATALSDDRFQNGRFESIANDVARTNDNGGIEVFPASINNNNEVIEVTVDDTYPIIVYNKVIRTQHFIPNKDYAGYRGTRTFVKMIVYGKRSALNITQEQLAAVIEVNFPESINSSKIKDLKLSNMSVTITDTNLNSIQVFNEEYKGFQFCLSENDLYFSINYQIEATFQKGCFKICDCK